MKILIKTVLMAVLITSVSGVVGYAEDWTIYGPRAQGMGGTGVAIEDGATASYWNPAGITLNDKFGLYIPFGTSIGAEGDIMENVDAVVDVIDSSDWNSISTKMDTGAALSQAELQTALDLFTTKIPAMDKEGEGFLLSLNGGLNIGLGQTELFGGNIGLFGNVIGNIGVDPTVNVNEMMSFNAGATAIGSINNLVGAGNDRSGVFTNPGSQALADSIATIFATAGGTQNQAEELVYQAELAGVNTSDPIVQSTLTTIAQSTATTGTGSSTVSTNSSGVLVSGISVTELGVTYGRKLMDGKMSLGGNLKLLQGETVYKLYRFDDMEEGSDFLNELTDDNSTKKSTTFGLDVGALYKVGEMVKLGLTGRNINGPKFTWDGPGDYKLDPQYRFGASLKVPLLLLSFDYDLNKTKSQVLEGYESQMMGLGAEINLIGFLFLRAGMYQNKAISGSGKIYTLGTSINLLLFKLDLAVAQADKEVTIESGTETEEIKERYGVSFALSFRY
ncbi:MAG: conjugal transfer protein TraF [Planctomycetes bacterium]|nr:conjugal transfer protein TraF [Planctomycetota bacterium]